VSVIVNNTVISNFAAVGRLDLLQELIGTIYITQEVLEEIKQGIERNYLFLEEAVRTINDEDWLLVTELEKKERELFRNMPNNLDSGERSCLAIAYIRNWAFLSDDKSARRYAQKNQISLSGTFGLLNTAIDENILSEQQADELLQKMIRNNYRSPYLDIYSYRRLKY
jgi:predicted nucleic acid-binding protein